MSPQTAENRPRRLQQTSTFTGTDDSKEKGPVYVSVRPRQTDEGAARNVRSSWNEESACCYQAQMASGSQTHEQQLK